MRIGLGCDHGGFELKEELRRYLRSIGEDPVDVGVFDQESVDYPDFGIQIAQQVSNGGLERGILICGTGIGMSIVANKFPGVRAAVVHDLYTARFSREHNDTNVLVLGGRIVGKELAKEIVHVWLRAAFAGGRHKRRLEKIEILEKENFK